MTGTLEHLDPATLLIGDNVRDEAVLDKQFVASVPEHGVLQPITAIRTDGGVEVRDGQRRTLAVAGRPRPARRAWAIALGVRGHYSDGDPSGTSDLTRPS